MNIDKAIKKQNSSHKRFVLIMCFIFFMNPLLFVLSGVYNLFLIAYLAIIEVLIIIAILVKKDGKTMSYEYYNGKLKLSQGLLKNKCSIHCSKVVFVHVESKNENKEKDLDILMITNSRFRNKKIREVDFYFLKNYPYVKKEYEKLKALNPEEEYYYIIVSKGKLTKYKLLMEIYKRCVNAKFSEAAIDAIKIWYSLG
ncbi:MAG: hypothetical protein GX370_03315 [Clostridia bacterium]|nr:hypothetical protein [Clostridia bacterium]